MPCFGYLTGEDKENNPVHDQNRPEYWDVEHLEPGADESDSNSAGCPVPELELGKSSDERAELLVLLRGQATCRSILHLAIYRIVGGVELGRQEGEEHVEQVNAERIGNYPSSAARVHDSHMLW